MKNTLLRIVLVLLLSCSAVTTLQAAENKAIELSADSIEYDSAQGILIAQGNVHMMLVVMFNITVNGRKRTWSVVLESSKMTPL